MKTRDAVRKLPAYGTLTNATRLQLDDILRNTLGRGSKHTTTTRAVFGPNSTASRSTKALTESGLIDCTLVTGEPSTFSIAPLLRSIQGGECKVSEAIPGVAIRVREIKEGVTSQSLLHQRSHPGLGKGSARAWRMPGLNRFFISEAIPGHRERSLLPSSSSLNRFFISEAIPGDYTCKSKANGLCVSIASSSAKPSRAC